jgi:copper(I)-binding protein
VGAIDLPANGSVTLVPGGLHIMLIDLTRELAPGDEVSLTLNFKNADPLTITAEIRESE